MNIVRFSAVEQFGLPLYDPEITKHQEEILRLVASYSIEAQPIPVTFQEDITPYYLMERGLHYFMSRSEANGPVQIHLMPSIDQPITVTKSFLPGLYIEQPTDQRMLEIPTDTPMAGLVAKGPRFEQACLHEVIVDLDLFGHVHLGL